MPELGLNIDHVATLREARYRGWKAGLPPEPNVLAAARLAEQAGVNAITVHLREDRRHIQEADVRELSRAILVHNTAGEGPKTDVRPTFDSRHAESVRLRRCLPNGFPHTQRSSSDFPARTASSSHHSPG